MIRCPSLCGRAGEKKEKKKKEEKRRLRRTIEKLKKWFQENS